MVLLGSLLMVAFGLASGRLTNSGNRICFKGEVIEDYIKEVKTVNGKLLRP